MKHLAYFVVIIICLVTIQTATAKKTKNVVSGKFIRVEGQNLLTSKGEKFFIKGTNLGNWLNPDGYMFLFKKTNAPRQIDQAFREMAGPDFAKMPGSILFLTCTMLPAARPATISTTVT